MDITRRELEIFHEPEPWLISGSESGGLMFSVASFFGWQRSLGAVLLSRRKKSR